MRTGKLINLSNPVAHISVAVLALLTVIVSSVVTSKPVDAAVAATTRYSIGFDVPRFVAGTEGCPNAQNIFRREGQRVWISRRGNSLDAGNITIPQGTRTVNLDINAYVFQCRSNLPVTINATVYVIQGASVSVNGSGWFPIAKFRAPAYIQIPVATSGINELARYAINSEPFAVDTSSFRSGNNTVRVAVASRQYNWFKNSNALICVADRTGAEPRVTDPRLGLPCGINIPVYTFNINVRQNDRRPTFTATTGCDGIMRIVGRDPDHVPSSGSLVQIEAISPLQNLGTFRTNRSNDTLEVDLTAYGISSPREFRIRMYNYRPDGTRDDTLNARIAHTWTDDPACPRDFTISPNVSCTQEGDRVRIRYEAVHSSGADPGSADVRMRYGIGNLSSTVNESNASIPVGGSWTRDEVIGPVPLGSEVFADIQLTPLRGGIANPASASSIPCVQVVLRPTLQVQGADVWAGGGYRVSSSSTFCDIPTGFVGGVNTNPTSLTNYATFATANIVGFGTGGNPSTSPNGNILAFANASNPPGNFNSQGKCVPDYFAELDKDAVFSGNYNTSGQFFSSTSIDINSPVSLPENRKITLVVDGDINITRNVTYSYGALSSPDEIPAIVLVASGNINIGPNVTQLDGLYVAGTGSDPSNGVINTCFDSNNPSNTPARLSTADQCHNSTLDVYGAFQAKRIEFRRTSGSITNSNERAERFFVTPEFYLSKPILESPFNRGFDVSSQQDLPPVY